VCSHVTLLDAHLSATYLVDLYSALIGQESCRADDVAANDDVELTLAAVISVFDSDKFNSCLEGLVTDVVRTSSSSALSTNFHI